MERLLTCNQLRRSERQREFLSYVCRVVLEEPEREIREVEIGCNVFGRPADYNTSQDNIVRVNASELRRRLEDYFNTDGAAEPAIVTISRGGYRPVFSLRAAAAEPEAVPLTPPAAAPPVQSFPVPPQPAERPNHALLWQLPLALLIGAAATFLVMVRWQGQPSAGANPAVSGFWNRMFVSGKPTAVVLADSCLSLYQDLTRGALTLDDYLSHQYLTQTPGNSSLARRELLMIMSRRYTSMADVQLLNRLTAFAYPPDRHKTSIHFARDLPPDELRNSNAIIIGSKRSNPWAELFEKSMNFRLEYDDAAQLSTIRNLQPQAGEQGAYLQAAGPSIASESYAIVALLPNLTQTGNVLLLSGAGMDGTQAAGEFITSEQWISRLSARIKPRPDGSVPYFEALLYTKRLGGGSVAEIQMRAIRVH